MPDQDFAADIRPTSPARERLLRPVREPDHAIRFDVHAQGLGLRADFRVFDVVAQVLESHPRQHERLAGVAARQVKRNRVR